MDEENKIDEEQGTEGYSNEWDEMVNRLEFLRDSRKRINEILD